MPIPSWSHSRLAEFEKCAYRAYLLHDAKVPEPQRPLPPGKKEHANDRGTRVHQSCEDFVSGKSNHLDPEAAKFFRDEMEAMRTLFAKGKVSLEGEWGMNQNWEPTGWRGQWIEVSELDALSYGKIAKVKALPDVGSSEGAYKVGKKCFVWEPAWLRLKLDALVFINDTEALAIDYKTGRKAFNEVKHGEQLQLYQLVTLLRYPHLETVHTELWYLDQDEITSVTFSRQRGLLFRNKWDKRATKLTTATEFPPNPNMHSCKWCQYGPWNGGQCVVGVR